MSLNVVLYSKRTVLFGPQNADSTTLTSAVIDVDGHASAVFETLLGALTTGQTKGVITVNAGNKADGSDMAPLGGVSLTIGDGDGSKLEVIEVFKAASFRYLQLVVTRNSQAAAISGVILTLHGTRRAPDSDDAATVAQTLLAVDPEYVSSGITTINTVYPPSTTQVVRTERTTS